MNAYRTSQDLTSPTVFYGPAAPALRNLARAGALPLSAVALLRSAAEAPQRRRRGLDLEARRGGLRFLSSGWAALVAKTPPHEGRLYALLLPGDPIDMSLIAPDRCAIVSLTRVETVDFSAIEPLLASSEPARALIAEAFQKIGWQAQDRLVAHMARLGARSAYEALLDFFTDLHDRLDAVDMVAHDGFHMPLSQAQIASALGLTTSHVNRTLQQLRREERLELAAERLTLTGARRS